VGEGAIIEDAIIGPRAQIGAGAHIASGAVIGPGVSIPPGAVVAAGERAFPEGARIGVEGGP
jgi:acetyltransferase-like isoleucine patch superfamily enzyme